MAIISLTTVTIPQHHPDPSTPYIGKDDPLTLTFDPQDPQHVIVGAEWHQLHLRVSYADLAEAMAEIAMVMDARH
jgi:hypothetical protein